MFAAFYGVNTLTTADFRLLVVQQLAAKVPGAIDSSKQNKTKKPTLLSWQDYSIWKMRLGARKWFIQGHTGRWWQSWGLLIPSSLWLADSENKTDYSRKNWGGNIRKNFPLETFRGHSLGFFFFPVSLPFKLTWDKLGLRGCWKSPQDIGTPDAYGSQGSVGSCCVSVGLGA